MDDPAFFAGFRAQTPSPDERPRENPGCSESQTGSLFFHSLHYKEFQMFKSSIIAAAFAVGLLTSGVHAQDAKAIPALKGTWEATSQIHHKVHGHMKDKTITSKLVVLSQEGRVFHGTVGWKTEKVPGTDTFSGVIDKDGVTFYVAGHTEGIRIGKLEGPDAFTFYILQPGGANPRAGFAEFKRVK